MKLSTKIHIGIAAALCGGWCCYTHVLYYHAYCFFYPLSKSEYATCPPHQKIEHINRIYRDCIIPLISSLSRINNAKDAQDELPEVTELCTKLYTQDCFSNKGDEIFTYREMEEILDKCITTESNFLPHFSKENTKIIKEVERLESADYYGCHHLKHLVKCFIYNEGILLYLPSATLNTAIDTSEHTIRKALWEERLKRKQNYILDVILLGAHLRWSNLVDKKSISSHNVWCDVYILDPLVGPHHRNNLINYSYNDKLRNISVLSPAHHFYLFEHCCPACQYSALNSTHIPRSPKVPIMKRKLEEIRIIELAQYTPHELKNHPSFITTYYNSLFFKLEAPCQSAYLEIIYREEQLHGMKYWKKLPEKVQQHMHPNRNDSL